MSLQNRKIFFGLAFGAARLRSPQVSKFDHLEQKIAKFSPGSLRRSRPAAREGWLRAGVKVRSHRVYRCMCERGALQHLLMRRSWVRISFVGSLNTISGQIIAFAWRGPQARHGKAPLEISILRPSLKIFEKLKNRRFSWNSAFSPRTNFLFSARGGRRGASHPAGARGPRIRIRAARSAAHPHPGGDPDDHPRGL